MVGVGEPAGWTKKYRGSLTVKVQSWKGFDSGSIPLLGMYVYINIYFKMKEKFNIKSLSRRYKNDVGGLLFLKSKLKFRFIKKWVNRINENMMEAEKSFIYNFDTARKKYLKKKRNHYKLKKRIWFILNKIGAAYRSNFRYKKRFKYSKWNNQKINFKRNYKNYKNYKNNNKLKNKNPNQGYWGKQLPKYLNNQKKNKRKAFNTFFKNNSKRFFVTYLNFKNKNYNQHKYFNKKFKIILTKFHNRRILQKKKYFHEKNFKLQYNKAVDSELYETYAFNRFFRKIPKRRLLNFVRFGLRIFKENKRLSVSNRLFKKKQQFKFFFRLKELHLKNLINSLKTKKFYLLDFYYFLEYRLDMIIYRAFYFQNIATAQQYIKNNGIYVNNIFTKEYNKVISIGSKIQLSFNFLSLCNIMYNLKNKYIILPPKYLEINYTTLSIIVKSFFFYKTKYRYYFTPKKRKNQFKIKRKRFFKDKFSLKNKNFYFYFLINEKKQYKRILKNKNKHKRYYQMLPIHYPFKITLEEIDSIFHLYY